MNNDLRYYGNPMNWENTKGDSISREALWQTVFSHTYSVKISDNENQVLNEVLRLIRNAPSVESYISPEVLKQFAKYVADNERPQGEWIFLKANEEHTDGYECSVCKRTYHTRVPYFSEFKFCPECGASMKGGAV